MKELGRIRRVDPRELWANEATDFTPWLASNLEELTEALGIELELQGKEAPVGDFSLDILAHDLNRDRPVVIENQLTPTDHDHLGKLITYASGYDATTVVWVATEIREEHRQALDWLNLHSDEDTDFFGVVVEVLKIGDSPPAVQLRPVAAPNNWRKERVRSSSKGETTKKGKAYQIFFQDLIDVLREKHRFTNARKAQPGNWYSFSSGVSGVTYVANFGRAGLSAQVYIDFEDEATNKGAFDKLKEQKQQIESDFGEPFQWERLDDKRACRIAVYCDGQIDDPPEKLAQLHDWTVERLLKIRHVFGDRLRTLPSS